MRNITNTSTLINILTNAMDDISKTKNHNEIHLIINKLLIDFTQSEFSNLLIFDNEKKLLYTKTEKDNINISMINPRGLLGNAYLSKEIGIFNHIASEKYYIPEIDNPLDRRIKSQIIMPVLDNDNLIGMIRVSRSIKYPNKYTKNDLDLIKSLLPFLKKMICILTGGEEDAINVDNSKLIK